MFASKVWLSESEHQRAGWIQQQHTACRSEWAGCQLHPSRIATNTSPVHQLARWVNNGLQHTLCFDLVSMESGETARDPGMNPFGEPYTSKSSCGLLYISDIQAMWSGKSLKWRHHVPNALLAASEHWEAEVFQFPNGHGISFDPK